MKELIKRLRTKVTASEFGLIGHLVEVLTDNCKEAATALESQAARIAVLEQDKDDLIKQVLEFPVRVSGITKSLKEEVGALQSKLEAAEKDAAEIYILKYLLSWAYEKLAYRSFSDIDDWLAMDEIKLHFMKKDTP